MEGRVERLVAECALVEKITEEAEGEDRYGEGVAGGLRAVAEEAREGFVGVFWVGTSEGGGTPSDFKAKSQEAGQGGAGRHTIASNNTTQQHIKISKKLPHKMFLPNRPIGPHAGGGGGWVWGNPNAKTAD